MELQQIKEELQIQGEKIDRNIKELELLKQISTDNLMAVLELRKGLEVLSREFKDFKDEMKAFKDEMKAFKDEMNKKWGELANRLGTLAEDIFGPGIPHLLKGLGYEVESVLFDLEAGPKGKKRQYDVLIFAKARDRSEKVFVAEVKNQVRAKDFDQMRKALEVLPKVFPAIQGKQIVPVMAAFRLPEDTVNLANKRGVLLVRMGGDYLEPLNPEVLNLSKESLK